MNGTKGFYRLEACLSAASLALALSFMVLAGCDTDGGGPETGNVDSIVEFSSFNGISGADVYTVQDSGDTYTLAPYSGGAKTFSYCHTRGNGEEMIWYLPSGSTVKIDTNNKLTLSIPASVVTSYLAPFSQVFGASSMVTVDPSDTEFLFISDFFDSLEGNDKLFYGGYNYINSSGYSRYTNEFWYASKAATLTAKYSEGTVIYKLKQGWNYMPIKDAKWIFVSGGWGY